MDGFRDGDRATDGPDPTECAEDPDDGDAAQAQPEGANAPSEAEGTQTGTERFVSADQDVPAATARASESVEFWERLGYSSFEAYIEDLERPWRRDAPTADLRRAERELVGLEPLTDDDLRTAVERRRSRIRQVGLKLAAADYERLAAVAESHDVSPATMARMLLKRALGAVVSELRELR